MLKEINSAHRMLERSHCHDGCGGVIEVIDVGEEAKPNKLRCTLVRLSCLSPPNELVQCVFIIGLLLRKALFGEKGYVITKLLT